MTGRFFLLLSSGRLATTASIAHKKIARFHRSGEPPRRAKTVTRRVAAARTLFFALGVLCCTAATARATAQTALPGAGHEQETASPRSSADAELVPVAVPEPSALALRFYRSANWLYVADVAWALLVPGFLAFSGASARVRTLAQRIGRGWYFTIALYVIGYIALVFALDLPLAFYEGFLRAHAYGLSNQSVGRWLGNFGKSMGVQMAAAAALAWVPYLLLARSPRRWWLYTAGLSVPFLFLTMLVVPVWISPLYNTFGPMKNPALERSILELANRAGIEGGRVYEVDKSADTNAINAYVTGVLQTKRIVLWDTLIAKLSEPELICVMAHEMGHYVHGHVVRSIWLSSILTLTGLFLVDRLGRRLVARYSGRLGFDRLSDVASLPLLLMLLEAVSLVLSPVALAYSRHQEHDADRYALNLTHSNHSAATAFVKLQRENLSNPRPGVLYRLFRSSHPSIGERIDFCNTYHPWAARRGPSESRPHSPTPPPAPAPSQHPQPVAPGRSIGASSFGPSE
jgi:Zn-dependent protease with chaperone function